MTVVGRLADFPEGTHRVVSVDGRQVGVFNIGGRLYGLPNRCAHQGGPLCAARRTTGLRPRGFAAANSFLTRSSVSWQPVQNLLPGGARCRQPGAWQPASP